HDVVGQNDVVAQAAIMRDMRIGKEQIVVANNRRATMFYGTGVHGHTFADRAVFANHQRGINGAVMRTLRIATDNGRRPDRGTLADRGSAKNHDMAYQLHVITQHNLWPYMAKRSNGHIFPD